MSDGKHLLRGKDTVRQDVVGAVAGDLSRAVEVYETGLRQGGLPFVEMLYGHNLAAEQHLPYCGRHAVTEAIHDRDKTHRADSPDQRCDRMICQIVHQLGGLAEIGTRDDLHLGTGV